MKPSWVLFPLALAFAGPGSTQEPPPTHLTGKALRGDEPLDSGTVVLHRVAPSGGAETDSASIGVDGGFVLELDLSRNADDVFFATVTHHGVLYYGEAFTGESVPDSYQVQVFDTLQLAEPAQAGDDETGGAPGRVDAPPGSSYLPLEIEGRTLFLEPMAEGWRVTDLISLHNKSERTWVSVEDGPVWSHPLPAGTEGFEVGHRGAEASAVYRQDDVLHLSGPVIPGDRLLIVQYHLSEDLPVFPLGAGEGWVELLIREPSPGVGADGLPFVGRSEVTEGSTYRRYRAESPGLSSLALISVREPGGFRAEWAAVLVAAALVLAFIARKRRTEGAVR